MAFWAKEYYKKKKDTIERSNQEGGTTGKQPKPEFGLFIAFFPSSSSCLLQLSPFSQSSLTAVDTRFV